MPRCSQPSIDGGYDYVFVEVKIAENYECNFCYKVFRNPFLAVCCGQHYCEVCIKKWREEKTACPHCREDGFQVVINRGKVREVKALGIYCINSRQQREANRDQHEEREEIGDEIDGLEGREDEDGCDWVGELGDLEDHLNANPTPLTQLKGCLFVELECKFCQHKIVRSCLREHQDNVCLLRDYICPYCNYSDTYTNVTEQHWEACPLFPIPCSYCDSEIERSDLEHHINTDCPLAPVTCIFEPIGCNEKFKRKYSSKHMREYQKVHSELIKDTVRITDAAKRKIASLFSERERQQRKFISEREAERHKFKSEMKTLESILVAEKRLSCKLNSRRAEMKTAMDSLSDENASLERTNDSLSYENASLEQTNDSLSDENASLEHRNNMLKDSLERTNDSLSDENASLEQRNEKLESEKQNVLSEITILTILGYFFLALTMFLLAMLATQYVPHN